MVLRAAGDSGVCSAGPAGCFYKGGVPLLHNACTYTHKQAQTHRCLQALVLKAQGYVVSAQCVTAQYVRYAAGRSPSSGRAFPVASV